MNNFIFYDLVGNTGGGPTRGKWDKMDRLIIECPDGELHFPKDVLVSSPYLKNTLIDKHFFGKIASNKPLFLNFLFEEIKILVAVIRTGKISRSEVLDYVNVDPDSLLNDGLDILKNGGMLSNGYFIDPKTTTSFDLNTFNDKDNPIYPYDEKISERRQKFTKRIAKEIIMQHIEALTKEIRPRHDLNYIQRFVDQAEIRIVKWSSINFTSGRFYPYDPIEGLSEFFEQTFPTLSGNEIEDDIQDEIRSILLDTPLEE